MKRILIAMIILMSYAGMSTAMSADLPDLSGVWKDTRGSNTNSITIMRIADGPTKTTYTWQNSSGYRFPYTGSITGPFVPTHLIVTKSDNKGKFVGTNMSPAAFSVQEKSIYSAITYDTTGVSDTLTIPTSVYSSDDVYLTKSTVATNPIDSNWKRNASNIYNNGGNVGIGTMSPQAFQDSRTIKLDVADNIVAKDIYLDNPKSGSPIWASELGSGRAVSVRPNTDFSISTLTWTLRDGATANINISGSNVLVVVNSTWYGGTAELMGRINRDNHAEDRLMGTRYVNHNGFYLFSAQTLFTGLTPGSHIFSFEVSASTAVNNVLTNAQCVFELILIEL